MYKRVIRSRDRHHLASTPPCILDLRAGERRRKGGRGDVNGREASLKAKFNACCIGKNYHNNGEDIVYFQQKRKS